MEFASAIKQEAEFQKEQEDVSDHVSDDFHLQGEKEVETQMSKELPEMEEINIKIEPKDGFSEESFLEETEFKLKDVKEEIKVGIEIKEESLEQSVSNGDSAICSSVIEDFIAKELRLCPYCSDKFEKPSEMEYHIAFNHPGLRRHVCFQCPKVFRRPRDLSEHMRIDHVCINNAHHICPVCDKIYSQGKKLRQHIRLNHPSQHFYTCSSCKKVFTRKDELFEHYKVHTQNGKHPCTQCNKEYSKRDDMLRHMASHSDARPFSCALCTKTFRQKVHLKAHVRSHSRIRAFNCTLCSSSFTTPSNLRRHFSTHSDERPFNCIICGKRFKQRSHLSDHLLIHSGERPHHCPLCSKTFSLRTTLRKHMKMHAPGRTFSCPECKTIFLSESRLAAHFDLHTCQSVIACEGSNKQEENIELASTNLECTGQENSLTYHGRNSECERPLDDVDPLRIHSEEDFVQSQGALDLSNVGRPEDINPSSMILEPCLVLRTKQSVIARKVTDKQEDDIGLVSLNMECNGYANSLKLPGTNSLCEGQDHAVELLSIKSEDNFVPSRGALGLSNVDRLEDISPSSMISEHLLVRTSNKSCACSECKDIFNTESDLEVHMEEHRNLPRDVPNSNEKRFDFELSSASLEEKPHKCFLCNGSFPSASELCAHSTNHTNGNASAPNEYNNLFNPPVPLYMNSLESGVYADKVILSCTQCNGIFMDPLLLAAHTKTHTNRILISTDCSNQDDNVEQSSTKVEEESILFQNKSNCLSGSLEMLLDPLDLSACKSIDTEISGNQALIISIDNNKLQHIQEPGVHSEQICVRLLNTPVSCTQCSKIFPDESSLAEHVKIHRKNRNVNNNPQNGEVKPRQHIRKKGLNPCPVCHENFKKESTMKHHLKHEHAEAKPYQCSECNARFASEDCVVRHRLIHTNSRSHICQECDRAFKQRSHLVEHMVVHTRERPFLCFLCGKNYPLRSTLRKHLNMHARPDSHSCSECSLLFRNRSLLTAHMETHGVLNQDSCNDRNNTEPVVGKMILDSPKTDFVCPVCMKTFNKKHRLNKHLKVHSDKRPYVCTLCHASFYSSGNLRRHEQGHSEVRTFLCAECGKRFRQRSHLTDHTLVHSGERPHHCPVCNKSFALRTSVRKHMKTHVGDPLWTSFDILKIK